MSHVPSTRRRFLKTTSVAVGGLTLPGWSTGAIAKAAPVQAKNDRPHIGAIGVGGRGSAVLAQAAGFGDVVAVCDVDRTHAEGARGKHGGAATIYDDYRRLLERPDIDVIVNAMPDHWHTAINIAACQTD